MLPSASASVTLVTFICCNNTRKMIAIAEEPEKHINIQDITKPKLL